MELTGIERKQLREIQIRILDKLDMVCKANGINYYLACGTCLGAIRHNGFIPWDDEVDVYIYYKDVKKLVDLQSEFLEEFFVQTKETDPEYGLTIARIRDNNSILIEADEENIYINHGVYVDVYPLYNAPKGRAVLVKNIWLSYIYRLLVANRPPINHGKVLNKISRIILHAISDKKRKHIINSIEDKLSSPGQSAEVLTYYGQDVSPFSAILYKSKWFEEPKQVMFEGGEYFGPTYPDDYLRKKYGNDFLSIPPKEKQIYHHEVIAFANDRDEHI